MPSTTRSPFEEYSYDFPIPSNSSLTLPTRKPPQVLHRRRSPSPSHRTPKYSPSTRAAEVSRLLDPTYSHPQGSGSTSSTSPLSVFVDHYGDIHDPEYRHFPVVTPRPKWERGAHDDDLAEEEDEDAFDNKRAPRVPAITSYTPSYAYAYQYDAPQSSYASQTLHDEIEESPFADETEKKAETARATKKHRRHSKPKHDEKRSLAAEDAAAEPATSGADYTPSEYGQDDWTPTCTQSIRREWQAITLRLRFSAFRTKRKIKRRLGTG
ncbi:hypothetical protein PILCRDRAFT_4743 [Piloderma croceum F 1598]|uniref:Uncharacterized protein n=1 Tax=Piloderma croceum (strain F 1598) TaxID=765440 RepID=A0A0C3C945_PILCF|nr:hypothetical protein PILCRDRAFT_4743 [Piloderma croceum F 1598]